MRPRIIVIRRDNIGDLVCTTPLLAGLRAKFPEGWIGVLVNSYNAPVLDRNPHVDRVFAYTKAKHRLPGESAPRIWWRTWKMLLEIRRLELDFAIIASPGIQPSALRFARQVAAKRIIGYGQSSQGLTDSLPLAGLAGKHETEAVMALGGALGITAPPGPLVLVPDDNARRRLAAGLGGMRGPVLGVHISSRRAGQRWPREHFVELLRELFAQRAIGGALLFWAPGAPDHPSHPGDDEESSAIMRNMPGLPLVPIPTLRLEDLIAGISLCDYFLCSDGGAMHLAAALGKPIVCFFGDSSVARWHPWGVRYELLQAKSHMVSDITPAQALLALARLRTT